MRAAALVALLALLVCAPAAAPEQCPCPTKAKSKPVKRKSHPVPTSTPSPSPTPTPQPEERMFEEPVFERPIPRAFEEPAPIPTPLPTPVPSPTPSPEGMKATVLAGGLVSFGSGTTGGKMAPLARIGVNGPIPLPGIQAGHFPRVLVSVDFTALPGESATLNTLENFKSLEFQLGVAQRVAPEMLVGDQRIAASLYAVAGFATRLPGDTQPRDQSPRFGAIGFRLDEWTSGSFVAVALAADQRFDGLYQPTLLLSGAVLLKEVTGGTLRGGRALLIGSAILGLSPSYGVSAAPRRDLIRVALVVGR